MRRSVLLFPSSAILLLAGLAAAQTTPPATGPDATIRTTSTEVLLDVAVTDKHGKNVKNLKQGDVEVYEDGVKQAVTSFRLGWPRFADPAARCSGRNSGRHLTDPAPVAGCQPDLYCLSQHRPDRAEERNSGRAEFLKDGLPAGAYVGMFLLSDRLTQLWPSRRTATRSTRRRIRRST